MARKLLTEHGRIPLISPGAMHVMYQSLSQVSFLFVKMLFFLISYDTGSAVYAFFITAPIIPGVNSSLIETHLNITLDGNLSGSFDSIPNGTDYGYNQLVYGNASLNYGSHTLVISSGGPSRSVLEFDYVIYT